MTATLSKALMGLSTIVLLSGCVTYPTYPTYSIDYDIRLVSVERPAGATNKYGDITIDRIDEGGVTKYSFTDEMVRIVWELGPWWFDFVLDNLTSHSVKMLWDEVMYVDENGMSKQVTHDGAW
ncbi:MAG: hypothetical protein KAU31_02575, partial [Spirochaetaceae bacterium]|nr:hypothetical protein [Spirochaetaceae bacterium]